MTSARFELFAALSVALHVGVAALLAGPALRPPSPKGAGAGESASGGGAAAIAGETFDVPELEPPREEVPAGESAPIEIDGPSAPEPPSADGAEAAEPRAARKARGHQATAGPAPAAPAPSEPPPLYGAVGDRSAGDLVATFKRMFPIAASSDPLWDRVPVGFYADGDVTFYLAPDGSLTHGTASASAAPAFRAAVARTTELLKHRLFTARGATTHLRMVVRVTGQLANHGAFTIDAAGSFELPSGKHVSVAIVER